jgi:hypothetical protein
MSRMCRCKTEFVGYPQDEDVPMPNSARVRSILEELWTICSPEKSENNFYWEPESEFCFRSRRRNKPEDRIFRIRDFEGRKTVASKRTLNGSGGIERAVPGGKTDHHGLGCGGIDLLGNTHSQIARLQSTSIRAEEPSQSTVTAVGNLNI